MISTGRMSKDYWSKDIWSGRKRMRKKNWPTMRFLSIEEEISTEEDIKHVLEAVVPVVHVFRISIPLKVLSLTAMDEKKHKGVTCFKCNQDGHIVKNCPYNNKQYNSRRESSNMAELEGVALISSTINRSDEWFIDSAATKHMTNDGSTLQNYIQYDQLNDSLPWRQHSDSWS